MSEKIEPALTAEEWKYPRITWKDNGVTREAGVYFESHAAYLFVGTDRQAPSIPRVAAVVALANAALPDSDARKITREKIDLLIRRQAEAAIADHDGAENWDWVKQSLAFADALESYLPPA